MNHIFHPRLEGNKLNKKYIFEVLHEVYKDVSPDALLRFMKELSKTANLRQYSRNKTDEDLPVVISRAEYKILKNIKRDYLKNLEDRTSCGCCKKCNDGT